MNMTLRWGAAGPRAIGSGDFEHHRHARRVVVRTGIKLAATDAQVVEMSRHDHPLVA